MGIEFIHRVIKTSLVLAFLGFLFVTVYHGFRFGAGVLLGTGWGCVNLYFLTNLITSVVRIEEIQKTKILLILLLKFPLLYFVGYLLLKINYFPIISLLSGFTLIFLVIFLKALGRAILSLDTFSKREKRLDTARAKKSLDSEQTLELNVSRHKGQELSGSKRKENK